MTTTAPYLTQKQIIECLLDAYPGWHKSQATVIAIFLSDIEGVLGIFLPKTALASEGYEFPSL
jgi:hypothetical protein